MGKDHVIAAIRNVAMADIPKNASVILFGSQARGDERPDSDWDILVIIDKDKLSAADHDLYSYPFWELGWKINAMIHPAVYTRHDWLTKSNPIFRENVEREGIVLCWKTKIGKTWQTTALRKLDRKYGRLISRLYELRQSGDYDDKFDATEEEIMPYFELVEQLLDVLKGLIGNNKWYIGLFL